MEATLPGDGPTRASRLPRRHGRRTQAPRDGWWLAPTCRKHAATSPDRPRPDLRAGMRTKMCSARRQAGRLALGRHGQARALSPVPIDTGHACQPCGANGVGRGAVRRGGCNLERLRRARPLAQWVGAGGCTAGGVPHRSEHPPHSQRPHSMHMYQARTEIRVPWGKKGVTRALNGVLISGNCVGEMVPCCKPQHAEVALGGSLTTAHVHTNAPTLPHCSGLPRIRRPAPS